MRDFVILTVGLVSLTVLTVGFLGFLRNEREYALTKQRVKQRDLEARHARLISGLSLKTVRTSGKGLDGKPMSGFRVTAAGGAQGPITASEQEALKLFCILVGVARYQSVNYKNHWGSKERYVHDAADLLN